MREEDEICICQSDRRLYPELDILRKHLVVQIWIDVDGQDPIPTADAKSIAPVTDPLKLASGLVLTHHDVLDSILASSCTTCLHDICFSIFTIVAEEI